MPLLHICLFATLGLTLVSGCTSSSTSGGSRPLSAKGSKTPDEEARDMIARAMAMSPEDRELHGRTMQARAIELRNHVSDETRQEIDRALATIVSETGSPEVSVGAPMRDPNLSPPKIDAVEVLPQPRELK